MLKRLSGTFSQSSDHLLLPPASPGLGFHSPSNSAPSSPHSYRPSTQGYPFPSISSTQAASHAATHARSGIDRQTLHKTLALLSALLVALDELRSASLAHAKVQKKVSKALKELGVNSWGDKSAKESRDPIIANALLSSAAMYETLGDVDAKLAKVIQNDYESINDLASKYFRKTAKEEKSYEESLAALDSKVFKATLAYNKHASKPTHSPHGLTSTQLDSLTASHSTYVQTLQSLQLQASQIQLAYGEQIATRRDAIGREVARCVTGLAEKSWRNRVDATRKGGEDVGRVLARGVWVSEGMENVGDHEKRGTELQGGGTESVDDGLNPGQDALRDTTPQPRSQEPIEEGPAARSSGSAERLKNVLARGPRAPSTSTMNTQNSVPVSTSVTTSSSARPGSSSSPPSPIAHSIPSPVHQAPPSPIVASTARTESPQSSAISRRESMEPPRSPLPETSSVQLNDLGGGRTLPRGWYLDPSFANHLEENGPPLSPRLAECPPQDTHSSGDLPPQFDTRPRLAERRQTYDALTNRREEDGTVLRRPTPRHGSAPLKGVPNPTNTGADEWGRNATGVQRESEGQRSESFVRRMSQKYGGNGKGEGSGRYSLPTRSTSPSAHARSNSRVSLLAKRYSSPPEQTPFLSASDPSASPPRRPLPPLNRPYSSLPFQTPHTDDSHPSPFTRDVSSSSSSSSSTPNPSDPHSRPLPTPRASAPAATAAAATPSSANSHGSSSSSTPTLSEPHPTFCAYYECTNLHYAAGSGREETTRAEEERLQRELRNAGGGSKGGTLRGLVGKGKEVFGRMG